MSLTFLGFFFVVAGYIFEKIWILPRRELKNWLQKCWNWESRLYHIFESDWPLVHTHLIVSDDFRLFFIIQTHHLASYKNRKMIINFGNFSRFCTPFDSVSLYVARSRRQKSLNEMANIWEIFRLHRNWLFGSLSLCKMSGTEHREMKHARYPINFQTCHHQLTIFRLDKFHKCFYHRWHLSQQGEDWGDFSHLGAISLLGNPRWKGWEIVLKL